MEQIEIDETEGNPIRKTLNANHILVKILEISAEQFRRKLFVVGTRSRQGDLAGFLNLRLVNKQFNEAVCLAMKKEFKHIQIDIDDHFIHFNEFTIGTHIRPPEVRRRLADNNDEDEEMPDADDNLQPEDSIDVEYLKRFLRWLADTFDPIVEHFKIFDSWSFKPCLLPESWWPRLLVFKSMHPDMDYCNCNQCIHTIRSCRRYFGPISFRMAEDGLKGQNLRFGTLAFADAFLADIALAYTRTVNNRSTFESERFTEDFGGIRCENLNLSVQTLASFRDERPKPQPLEVIQLILKLWDVKTAEFEVVRFMENEYYMQRTAWQDSGAFHFAYFSTYSFDRFEQTAHVLPFWQAGTLDKFACHEFLPIFDLRLDQQDNPLRMGSNLSLVSRLSRDPDEHIFQWYHQGRIAFHMFRANRILFVNSGVVEYRGDVGTANWLKLSVREMMRETWGPRDEPVSESGKTVFWIDYIEDVSECIGRVWNEHFRDLLEANFPKHTILMDTEEAFTKCDDHRISTYDDVKRPDVRRGPVNIFYVSLIDASRNNTTNFKFVQIEN